MLDTLPIDRRDSAIGTARRIFLTMLAASGIVFIQLGIVMAMYFATI